MSLTLHTLVNACFVRRMTSVVVHIAAKKDNKPAVEDAYGHEWITGSVTTLCGARLRPRVVVMCEWPEKIDCVRCRRLAGG